MCSCSLLLKKKRRNEGSGGRGGGGETLGIHRLTALPKLVERVARSCYGKKVTYCHNIHVRSFTVKSYELNARKTRKNKSVALS